MGLPPRFRNPSEEEKIEELKVYICNLIRREITRRGWSQKDAAFYLRTTEAMVSRVVRYRMEKVTLSQLFRILAALQPCFEIMISLQ